MGSRTFYALRQIGRTIRPMTRDILVGYCHQVGMRRYLLVTPVASMALRQPKDEAENAGSRGAEGHVARPRVCNTGGPEDGAPAPPPAGVRRRGAGRGGVGAVSGFPEGRSVEVMASGREVAVVRWRGQIYAIRNLCPHQSEALVGGVVQSRITGAEGGEGRGENA